MLASAAGAVLLAGCSSGAQDGEEGGGSTSGDPSVTERAHARAASDSHALLTRYDAVLAGHPGLAGLLGPLRAEVARHVEAFGGVRRASPSPAASPTGPVPSPTGSATAAPATAVPSPAPVAEKDALAQLAAAERTLADRRAAELVDLPGEPARLLASVAAAGAAHAYLLTEGTR